MRQIKLNAVVYGVLLVIAEGCWMGEVTLQDSRRLDVDTTEAGDAAEGDQWRREVICMHGVPFEV